MRSRHYYNFDTLEGTYIGDHVSLLAADAPTAYHVEDTWEHYDKTAAVINQRFEEWKRAR